MAGDLAMVEFADMAAKVRAMQPRALTPELYPDVVLCLEWMQAEIVQRLDTLDRKRMELEAREEAVSQRERQAAIRGRVFGAAQP